MTDRRAIARNIASGQAAIYAEIAPALTALLEVTLPALRNAGGAEPDWPGAWERLAERLVTTSEDLNAQRTGAIKPVERSDVTVLQRGLAPYFEVLRTGLSAADPNNAADRKRRKERAELILLGNLRLVAYEQRRLQKLLEKNLWYVPQALRVKLAMRWLGRPTLISSTLTRAYPYVERHLGVLDEAFQIAATRYVYSLTLGNEELLFGVDLPPPPPAHPLLRDEQPAADQQRYAKGDFFPYDLQVIESDELWAEWHRHDRSSGEGRRTAVDNWLRYPERLNFIANVFRSRQQLTALYGRPTSSPAPLLPPATLGAVHDGFPEATDSRLAERFKDRGAAS
jgi:hypothetical protein